jgi:hypothetical protein
MELTKYAVTEKGIRLVPVPGTFIIESDTPASFYRVFPGIGVVIIGVHSDDAIIHSSALARLCARLTAFPTLVTVLYDADAGVTDRFARDYMDARLGKHPGAAAARVNRETLLEAKRLIRHAESQANAEVMGLGGAHIMLGLDWPFTNVVYRDGRLMSYESDCMAPSAADREKIFELVGRNRGSAFVMAHPQSFHPHHRQATNLLIGAIKTLSPESPLVFWKTKAEKTRQEGNDDNLFVYLTDAEAREKYDIIARCNDSQNLRNGSRYFYSCMADELTQYNYAQNPYPFGEGKYLYRHAEGFMLCRLA